MNRTTLLLPTVLLLLAGGCATTTEPTAEAKAKPAATLPSEATKGLNPEMLYDLLLASIASQRDQPQTALEALTRAAYQSRDPRVIASATRLALAEEAYQQAADLARLWSSVEPEEPTIKLVLASALLELNESERAFRQLALLLQSVDSADRGIYQAASDLVGRHYPGDDPLRFFQRLIDLRPRDANGWFAKALLANRLDDPQAVLRAIDRALELRPDWDQAALIKLAILADTKQDAALKAFADRFGRDHPQAVQFRLQYARVLFENHDHQGALRQFEALLKSDPENTDALYAAGLISLDAGEFKLARNFLRRHVKLLPDHDQTRIYLANAAIGRKNHVEAKQWLGQVIAKTDGVDAALAHLRDLTAKDSAELAELYATQDELLRDAGRLHDARRVLDEALEQLPDNTDLLYSRGLLAAQLKQVAQHETDMRRLIELEPDNAHAYNALGYTLADLTDRYPEARALVEKALELRPDDPFILDSMGWVQYRLGDNAKAAEYLRRALRIRQDPEIAAHLGEVLWASGKRQEAEQVWSHALKLNPNHALLETTIERLKQSGTPQQLPQQ
ncbi:MAG: tetratricopeptide repeat protein [Pseudomonadota bacterium]|nr:tetratricopeptide repeat protein [Pseudomonadota bacterium]